MKTEEDFMRMIPEINQGSITYYRCRDYLLSQEYYFTHKLRKNGVIALWIHFEIWDMENEEEVDSEKWKTVSCQWATTYVIQGTPLVLYDKLEKKKGGYTYDLCYTSVSKQGKLSLNNMTHCVYQSRLVTTKSYAALMKTAFGTKTLKDRVKKEMELCQTPDKFDPKKIPEPLENETSYEYAGRVRDYVKEKEDRIKELESMVSELTSERTKLTERDKAAIAIADKYSDFRTLRSDLIMGRRMNACKKYYADQGDKDTVKFLNTLSGYGKTILEQQKS